MEFDKLFSEIEEELRNHDERVRGLSESLQILNALKKIGQAVYDLLELYPSLEVLFEKDFGRLKHIFNRDSIIQTALSANFLIPAAEEFPLPEEQAIDQELLDNYVYSFEDWLQEIKDKHLVTQSKILEHFTVDLKFSDLSCHCSKCTADFRAKLRESVYKDQVRVINEAKDEIEDLLVEAQISHLSDYVAKLRKSIDRATSQMRHRLKRGSLNKLESDIKSHFRRELGPRSELGLVYRERLKTFFNGILVEQGHSTDLLTENEYDRFFNQMGIGLWKNPKILQRDFAKLLRSVLAFKRKDISATILREYLGQFWIHSAARHKKRRVIYHMGPTNSGKTYNAIEALSKAKNGSYLAPLRLLASELYDTLNDKGVSTTLLTGEEVIEVEGASHFSSTIEMAKFEREFECVVIDEIQMITDPQRGWAWTRALINSDADEIHLCGDQSVFELVQTILKLTGDTLEVCQYERKTDLCVLPNPIKLVELEKNDTLIVFSRRNALKYKRDLENLGFKVSIVYGRLSPEVRREQARKFDEGETDIMVATDAIAMGMNLPIRRVIFSAISKFWDGKEFPLTDSELKQIAGRAGRFQRFPEGFVTCLTKVDDGIDTVKRALNVKLKQKELAMVGPDLEIFRSVNMALEESNLKTLSLSEFLRLFNTMTFDRPFYCVDLKEMIELAETVEDADSMNSLSDAEIFGFACAPVNQGLMEHVQYYVWILNHYVGKQMILNEEIDVDSEDIDYLETAIKCVELYQWLARHFDNNYFSFDQMGLLHNKTQAIERLNQTLSEKTSRKCSSCGVKLEEEFKYHICETCFSQRRFKGGPGHRGKRLSGRSADKNNLNKNDKSSSTKKKSRRKKTRSKNKAAAFKRG